MLGWDVKQALVPSDLLDWLEGRPIIALIDAAQQVASTVMTLPCPSTIANISSHAGSTSEERNQQAEPGLAEKATRPKTERPTLTPRVTRLRWPDPRVIESLSMTVHDLNLVQVLRLADRLGWLPPHVELWAIEVETLDAAHWDESTLAQIGGLIATGLQELTYGHRGLINDDRSGTAPPPVAAAVTDHSTVRMKAGHGDA